jgi:hypothetical protein
MTEKTVAIIAISRPSSIGRTARIAAVFAAVGPLIGLGVVTLAVVISAVVKGNASDIARLISVALTFGVLVAYVAGFVPALLTGLCVARYAAVKGYLPTALAVVAGWLFAGLSLVAMRFIRLSNQAPNLILALIMAVAVTAASIVCARIARRWATNPSMPPVT